MTKRAMLLTLGLLACVTVLIAANTKATEEPREPQTEKPLDAFAVAASSSTTTKAAAFAECYCPMYPWAYHEGWWSYYAIQCSNCSPGNLDARPNLPSTACPGCWGTPDGSCPEGCIQVMQGDPEVRTKSRNSGSHLGRGNYVQDVCSNGDAGIGRTGFQRKLTRKYQIRLNRQIATSKGEAVVKIVRKNGKSFLAKLALVSIDPQRIPKLPKRFSHLPVRTQGIGFEIDEPGSTRVDSDHVVKETDGNVVAIPYHTHFYRVRYQKNWYHVVCHASHVR